MRILHALVDYGTLKEQSIPLSLDSVVHTLSKLVRPITVPGLTITREGGVLVGEVSRNEVRLSRARPLRSNIFKPFFYGKLVEHEGKTILSGKFVMHPVTVFVIAVFYCLLSIISVLLFLAWFGQADGSPIAYPLSGPAVLVLLTGFVWFVRWISCDDVQWISAHIRDALAKK